MMKKINFLGFIFIIFVSLFSFCDVKAIDKDMVLTDGHDSYVQKVGDEEDETDKKNCQYVFGDPADESSVAWMVQKFFNYVKIIGPLLVIVLSSIDFAKSTLLSDSENMRKTTKKFTTRMLCAVLLYFIPLLVTFLFNLINNSTGDQTCGIM